MLQLKMIRLKRAWSLALALRSRGDLKNLGTLHRLMLVRTAKKSANTENDDDCDKCKQIIEYLFSPLRTPEEMKKIQQIILDDIKKLQKVMEEQQDNNNQFEPCTSECERCNQIIAAIFSENNVIDLEEKSKPDAPITVVEKLLSTTAKQTEEQLAQKVETIDETPLVEAENPKITGFNTPPRVLGQEELGKNRSVSFESNASNIETDNMRHQFEKMVRRLESSEILRNVTPIRGGVLNCACGSHSQHDDKSGDSSGNKLKKLDFIANKLPDSLNHGTDARLTEKMKLLSESSDKSCNPSEDNETELEIHKLDQDQYNSLNKCYSKQKSLVRQFQATYNPNDAAKLRAEGIRFVEQKPPNDEKSTNMTNYSNEKSPPPYDPNRLFADRRMYYFNSLKETENKNVYKANERSTFLSKYPWFHTDQDYFDNLVTERFKLPEKTSEKVPQNLLTSESQEFPVLEVLGTSRQVTHSNVQEGNQTETLNMNAHVVKESTATNIEDPGHKEGIIINEQNESQLINEVTETLYMTQSAIKENQNVSIPKDTISPFDKENLVSEYEENDSINLHKLNKTNGITDANNPKEKPVDLTPSKQNKILFKQYNVKKETHEEIVPKYASDVEHPIYKESNPVQVHEDNSIADTDYPKAKQVDLIPSENAQMLVNVENVKKETHEQNVPEYLIDPEPPINKESYYVQSLAYPTENENKPVVSPDAVYCQPKRYTYNVFLDPSNLRPAPIHFKLESPQRNTHSAYVHMTERNTPLRHMGTISNEDSNDKKNIVIDTDFYRYKPETGEQQTNNEAPIFYSEIKPEMHFYRYPQMPQCYGAHVPYYRHNYQFPQHFTIEQNDWAHKARDGWYPQNYYDAGTTYYGYDDSTNQYSDVEAQMEDESFDKQSSPRTAVQGVYTPTKYSHLEDQTDGEYYVDAQSCQTPEQLQRTHTATLYPHLEDQISEDEYIDLLSKSSSRPVDQLQGAHDPTSQTSEEINPSEFIYQAPPFWSNQYLHSQSSTPPFFQKRYEQIECGTAQVKNENSNPWVKNQNTSWMEHQRYSQVPFYQQPLQYYEGEEAEGSQPEYFINDQNKQSKLLDSNIKHYSDPYTDVNQTADSDHDAYSKNVETRTLNQLQGALYTVTNYKKPNDQEILSFPHQHDQCIYENAIHQKPQSTEAFTLCPPLDSNRPYFSNEQIDFDSVRDAKKVVKTGYKDNESSQYHRDLRKRDPFCMQLSMDKTQANIFQIFDQMFDPNNPNHKWIVDKNEPYQCGQQQGYVYYEPTKPRTVHVDPYFVVGTEAMKISKYKTRVNRRAPMSKAKKDFGSASPTVSTASAPRQNENYQSTFSTPIKSKVKPCMLESLPLSEALRRIRKRNRQEHIAKWAQLEGKCGTPKPPCPPPQPVCPPPPPPKPKPCPGPPPPCPRPCKPRCPSPCVPTKPPCAPPPPCCSSEESSSCKFVSVSLADTICQILTLFWETGFAGLCTASKSFLRHSDTGEKITRDVIGQLQAQERLTTYDSGIRQTFCKLKTLVLARDFDPWVPIPSWPIPVKKEKKKIVCPKEGCKERTPPKHGDPCERPCYPGNPCIGFPNQYKRR